MENEIASFWNSVKTKNKNKPQQRRYSTGAGGKQSPIKFVKQVLIIEYIAKTIFGDLGWREGGQITSAEIVAKLRATADGSGETLPSSNMVYIQWLREKKNKYGAGGFLYVWSKHSLGVPYSKRIVKGTVLRDVSGVENRLKRSVLTNYKTASMYFLILNRHHHERSKKLDSVS
jgi:hypothetical protein